MHMYWFIRKLYSSLYLFFWMINTKLYKKKIQAKEKDVYGRTAKEKIEKREENKIKKILTIFEYRQYSYLIPII